jgi:predicted PurR-regulated permease PerM
VVYRLLEDYLINPRIFGKTVDVPPMVTVVAVLFGGALGGVLGALVAIPAAASVRILLEEVAYPYLDQA